MTPHPARAVRCAKRQIEVFERIAAGDAWPDGSSPRTLDALASKGLIVDSQPHGSVFNVPQYEVPTAIHIQWCTWCSENIKEEYLL